MTKVEKTIGLVWLTTVSGLVGAAVVAAFWAIIGLFAFFSYLRKEWILGKLNALTGDYTIKLNIPDCEGLVCDLHFEAVSRMRVIRSVRYKDQEGDLFELLTPVQGLIIERQIDEFLAVLTKGMKVPIAFHERFS